MVFLNRNIFLGDEVESKQVGVQFLDPSSKFLAISIDSYLSQKTLLDLKIYSMRIKNIDHIINELGTKDLIFRIKIWSGNTFWTSTPFSRPKLKESGATCEFKQTYRIRVDPAVVEFVTVSLWATTVEAGKIPDVLKSLKKEVMMGYTKIPTANIQDQKKVVWIPLNKGIALEDHYLSEDQPIVSMNFKLIQNAPGNYPEAPLCGKAFNINELATYNEIVPLVYPLDEIEFNKLLLTDKKFDPDRAGKRGCPLRYPANESEWESAALEKGPYKPSENPLQSLVQPSTKIPFMFRMPPDEDIFKLRQLPGIYSELAKKYAPGDLVSEMDSNIVKRICVIKAIDQDEDCYLIPVEQVDNEKPQLIKVFFFSDEKNIEKSFRS